MGQPQPGRTGPAGHPGQLPAQPGPTGPVGQPQPGPTAQPGGFPSQPAPTVQQPTYGQGYPSGGYGAGGPSSPPGGEHFADGGGSGPGSGLSTGLLVALGVLVLILVGGIVFVLTSKDDDEPDDRTDTSTSTTSTTESTTTTTVDDTTSDQVVEEFATAIHEGSNGDFTLDQARCMAAGILDVIGLERLAEVRIEAGDDAGVNPVDLLTDEEQTAAFDVMRDCVPAGEINEQPTSG